MSKGSLYNLFLANKFPWGRFPGLSESTISIIKNFLRHKKYYYREATLINYIHFLPRALAQLKVNSIEEITSDHIINWMSIYLKNKSQWTQTSYTNKLNNFFNYCLIKGYITKSPILRRFKPKRPLPISRSLDQTEYAKVRKNSELLPLQERTIIEFIDSSAARCGELLNIKVSDLDLSNCKVPIIGKAGSPGVLDFSKECSQLLNELIEKRESPQDYVFLKNRHQMRKNDIWKITTDLGKKIGIKGSLHPHRFRHTRATLEARKGKPLEEVSKKLRHKNRQTTMVYVHLLPEKTKYYYERAMKLHENARSIK